MEWRVWPARARIVVRGSARDYPGRGDSPTRFAPTRGA
ncbi:hypothetical protein DB30_04238 [Enhygromyxa salina]|uniref:Uncharacterized protein n=1 Tax=Enhygromyxa salina TaxID=215803 RepID=A0A0C1ZG66_9BACT|nr:hypothetical protein DB30_04238 [Enhygromyxa salina]